jgi:hypothetical protein
MWLGNALRSAVSSGGPVGKINEHVQQVLSDLDRTLEESLTKGQDAGAGGDGTEAPGK